MKRSVTYAEALAWLWVRRDLARIDSGRLDDKAAVRVADPGEVALCFPDWALVAGMFEAQKPKVVADLREMLLRDAGRRK